MGKSINRPAVTVPAVEGQAAVRCSYVTLAKARAFQPGSPPKFSIDMLFDKKNEQHMVMLNALAVALNECLLEQWPDVKTRPLTPIVAKTTAHGPKSPIKDADVAVNEKGHPILEANPEYAGHYIVRASCNEDKPPHIVGGNKQTINPSLCRSGFWYKVNCNAYAYTGGAGGVTIGLNGVQLIKEDEAFGGGQPSADSMFGAVEGANPELYGEAGSTPAAGTDDAAKNWLAGAGGGQAENAEAEGSSTQSLL